MHLVSVVPSGGASPLGASAAATGVPSTAPGRWRGRRARVFSWFCGGAAGRSVSARTEPRWPRKACWMGRWRRSGCAR